MLSRRVVVATFGGVAGIEGGSADEPCKSSSRETRRSCSLPLELAGRWVAWSSDGLRIIGSGKTLEEAEAVAAAAGEDDPIFEVAMGGLRR
jgi:hypothetical protein